jgi:hypothetical protein
MEVFVIPVGPDRYELYCEVPDEDPDEPVEAPRGVFRGLVHRFKQALAEAERERHLGAHEASEREAEGGWFRRLKRYVLRKTAESIAEQRLLWHMRRQAAAAAIYPEDLARDQATQVVHGAMQSDYEKHRRWLIIDGVFFVLTGLLILIPGPNLPAYYLAFRLVGHYLSMRGARQALTAVEWEWRPSAPLAELRQAIALAPEERDARVSDIASRLRLERLATFFARTAVPSA